MRPGDRLPSVRQFSSQQGVSVPTALHTYATLETRGLIEARPKSGFYVRSRLPEVVLEPSGLQSSTLGHFKNLDPLDSILSNLGDSKLVPLGAALPSPDLLPGVKLARTMASIARKLGPASGNYDMIQGSEALRCEIARRSLGWGCALKSDDFIVTNGCTEAISLALRATCAPGDTVAVESPTYFGLARMINDLGLRALPILVDETKGIDLERLETALQRKRISAAVVIPNFHNPVGFLMPDDRKEQLVRMFQDHRVPIIEDDIHGDLQHVGSRPRCLKAFDRDGSVVLCGSFSKTLAPGYRAGYISSNRYRSQLLALKRSSSLVGATLPLLTVAEFLRNGGYDRHLRSIRRTYRQQLARMREAVTHTFPKGIDLSRPRGGFLLWCQLPSHVDSIGLFRQALLAGISVAPGSLFSQQGTFRNFIRINCGYPWSSKIERSVEILGQLVQRMVPKSP